MCIIWDTLTLYLILLHDAASLSDITACNTMDKPLGVGVQAHLTEKGLFLVLNFFSVLQKGPNDLFSGKLTGKLYFFQGSKGDLTFSRGGGSNVVGVQTL